MRIATWNLEWARPGSDRHRRAVEHLETIDADVIVTTEDHLHEWDAYPHRADAGPDWGYPPREGRRKVIAWSRTPWSHGRALGTDPVRGRFLSVVAQPDGCEPIQIFAVCIPWRDAHVRTGHRNRDAWEDHVTFCAELRREITRIPAGERLVVAGDFNQRMPRARQPVVVGEALADCLDRLHVPTAGEQVAGRLIDHVAVSADLRVTAVESWTNVIEGERLSDHSGCVVTIG
jgi:endonuclease/exonuclease/phosphatase family metal-dependent hydrolase